MRCFLLLVFSLPWVLYAETVDQLVHDALIANHGLKAIQYKIDMFKWQGKIAGSLSNPEVMFGVNDIRLDEPSSRDLEPMQFESVTVKQPLPSYGERDTAEMIAKHDEQIMRYSLQEAQVQLVASIKKEVYAIWRFRELLKINEDALELTRQNIALNEAYTASSRDHHMGVMSAQLTASELLVRKNEIAQSLKSRYARLSYLVNRNITDVDIDLQMLGTDPNVARPSNKNRGIKRAETVVERERQYEEFAHLKEYPRSSVQVGYYHRQAYEDYVSIQVGLSLPIYGNETYEQERARLETLVREEELHDMRQSVNKRIVELTEQLNESYNTYAIIEEQSLPQIEHMTDLNSASIRSGADLFDTIKLMRQKLALDSKKVDATARYYTLLAEIDALQGELR